MCIACELGLLLAFDDLPDEPPPGFPRPRRDEPAGFTCDAPEETKPTPSMPEGERKP